VTPHDPQDFGRNVTGKSRIATLLRGRRGAVQENSPGTAGRPVRTEPRPGIGDEAAHHAAYLAFYRATIIEKCRSLPEAELRRPWVPSGWTLLELVNHLAYMERRWFVWGFLGEEVDDPWGDSGSNADGAWFVTPGRPVGDVIAMLEGAARRTEAILVATPLETPAASTGRFRGEDPPDLRWICFHVLQEYARHAGHVDMAVEQLGGPTGE
jgi:hypothetical protein